MMMGPINNPEKIARARQLRAEGTSYTRIGRMLSTTPTTVKRWLDPAYAAHRRTRINVCRKLRQLRTGEETA